MTPRYKRDLRERAFALATTVFRLFREIERAGAGHAHVGKQLLRAVSSIGANLEEGQAPSSRKDMAERHAISLREAREANFWSRLLATDPAYRVKLAPIVSETGEFVAMLTASVKKLRQPVTSSPPASDL